jgi:hypothetical protein
MTPRKKTRRKGFYIPKVTFHTGKPGAPAGQSSAARSFWFGPLGKLLLAYYVVMVAFGLLIPENILSTHSGLKTFTDFMAAIVPQIDRVTELGQAPEVNRLVYSVLWVVGPVVSYYLFSLWINNGNSAELGLLGKNPQSHPVTVPQIISAWLLFASGIYIYMWIPEYIMDTKLARWTFINSNGVVFSAPFITFSVFFFFVSCFVTIKLALTGKITWVKGFWVKHKDRNHG